MGRPLQLWCLAALAALATLAVPQRAEAALRLCNETSYVLHAAAAYQQGVASKTEGWIIILPGIANAPCRICRMMRRLSSSPNRMRRMPAKGWCLTAASGFVSATS